MAEIQTGEFSKYRSNLIDMHADMKVWLWDCGPEEPDLPEPPEMPSGKDGPALDLARLQYKRKLLAYEQALLLYERNLADWQNWTKHYGGPIEVMQWSCDARDTLRYDALAVTEARQTKPRWHLSARTRGYGDGRLKKAADKETGEPGIQANGLPLGMKPGHGHAAAIERQIAGEKEFIAAMKADPVFGQEIRA